MATWVSLIEESLKRLSVLADGEDSDEQQISTGVKAVKDMLDHWSLDGLIVPVSARIKHTPDSSERVFRVGIDSDPEADITVGPSMIATIDNIVYRDSYETGTRTLQKVPEVAIETYASDIATSPSDYSVRFEGDYALLRFDAFTDPGDSFTIVGQSFFAPDNLEAYDDSGDPVEHGLPRGYERAVKYNLALEMADIYGVTIHPATIMHAQESKRALRKRNAQPIVAELELAVLTSEARRNAWLNRSRW